jgi:hypothetical protein
MPTPTGLPRKGDVLVHHTGVRVVVVERSGGLTGSLLVRSEDGRRADPNQRAPGYPADHLWLHEYRYWLKTGRWRFA